MSAEIRHLRHFVAVADAGSFAGAAKTLALTQPALSRSVQALERRLGGPLLDRGSRGVVATPRGQFVLERARRLLLESARLEEELGELDALRSGSVRVGLAHYPAELSGLEATARLLAGHPRIRQSIRVASWTELVERVLDATFDLVIAEASEVEKDSRFEVRPCARYPLWFYVRAGHPLAGRERVALGEVYGHPIVGVRAPARMVDFLPRESPAGVRDERSGQFVPAVEVAGVATATRVVLRSDGIAVAPLVAIEAPLLAGEVRLLPVHAPWLYLQYGIIRAAARRLSQASEAYVAAFVQVEAEVLARNAELSRRFGPGAAP